MTHQWLRTPRPLFVKEPYCSQAHKVKKGGLGTMKEIGSKQGQTDRFCEADGGDAGARMPVNLYHFTCPTPPEHRSLR